MKIVTATDLKYHMKQIFESSEKNKELVVIKRSNRQDMVILQLSEYESLKETAYLLGTKSNANHLRQSLDQLKKGKTVEIKPQDLCE